MYVVAGVGSQSVDLSANVFRLAQGSASPTAIDLGFVRAGSIAQQAITVENLAVADGFSESLNASFGASTDNVRTPRN